MPQLLAYSLVYGLIGVALVFVLWPTTDTGKRLLERWGVRGPTEQQSRQAAHHLRDQRLLAVPLLALGPVVSFYDTGFARFIVPLAIALLAAELMTAIRPVRGPRTATLTRRHWYDLVPRWSIAVLASLATLAVLLAVTALLVRPWANRAVAEVPATGTWRSADGTVITVSEDFRRQVASPVAWAVIGGALVAMVAVLAVVWLTVRRASVADVQVDAVLRTRNARGAVGLGMVWMATLVLLAGNRLSFLRSIHLPADAPTRPGWLDATVAADFIGLPALLGAVAAWIWTAQPSRRMPYVQATT
ncbi:hypothetical protein [Actinocrispum sp. NPDC049592]|uniref:hypothetical protein n=1 Tax=Actinocrispum sp. NPDC049592 TaxID=3154835 RepID=UPI00341EDB0A